MPEKAPEKFNPREHVKTWKLKPRQGPEQTVEYLPARWRLHWLKEQHPDADVVTGIVHFSEHGCLVQAEIKIPDPNSSDGAIITATGHGFCSPQKWSAYVEKAETTAVGRALAHAGFGSEYALSMTDLDDEAGGEFVVDTPVNVPENGKSRKPPAEKPVESEPSDLDDVSNITTAWADKLEEYRLAAKLQEGQVMHWIKKEFGPKSSITDEAWPGRWASAREVLNRGQARQVATMLKENMPKE